MKKLLSLLLALSLILSVAPMSFADDVADEPIDEPGMYFNFNAAGYGSETDIGYDTIKSYDDYVGGRSTTPTWATKNGDSWRVDGECFTYEADEFFLTDANGLEKDTNGDGVIDDVYQSNALSFKAKGSDTLNSKNYNQALKNIAVAITLKVDESGIFTPSLEYHVGPALPKCSVYLMKRSASTVYDYRNRMSFNGGHSNYKNLSYQLITNRVAKVAGTKLGEIDMYAEEDGTRTTELTSYEIPEGQTGEYVLFLQMSNVNTEVYNVYKQALPDYVTSIHSFNLTPVPAKDLADAAFKATEDPDYTSTNSASVTRLAYYGDDVAAETIGDVTTVNYGESLTIDGAEKTVTKGDKTYNFSYWAKGLNTGVGNKQILSTALSFDYKPSEGTNYLIAVYEEEGNAEEAFYNYNGQLLSDLSIGEDGTLPALPAMAGLGNAIGWEQLGTGDVFEAGYDVSELEGDKVFMAKYNEPEADITINGESYSYGDVVSCKDIVDSMENFSYFTRKIGSGKEEIMSIDPDYSFSAYTDCTIEAVCNGSVSEEDLGRAARKILFSTFSVGENLTAVMAEFIGFDGAKEKGIMFGSQKIAMTTDKNQFTVTNDTIADVTVTGYAIVDEGGTTVKYTDGSISVAGVTAE